MVLQMQNLIITNSGEELTAKLIAGTTTAAFTKIAASDYDYSGIELKSLVELNDVRQTVQISSVTRTDVTMIEVLAAMDNSELTAGYYTRALGVYAEDGDGNEILFGVSVELENPSYLPPFSGKTISSITYRLNIKVDNSEQVKIELNPGAYPTMEQLEAVQVVIDTHVLSKIYDENGVHGLRYYNDEFQVMNESGEWVDIETGGGGIAPSNVIEPKIKVGNQQLTISWSDPADTVVDGQTLCSWKGTKLIQKVGAFPENIKDGVQLVDNQERDAYKDNGFVISNLTNGTTYYFALFPYSDTGVVNSNELNRLSGTPQPYKKMTVNIDLSNSNPSTSVTYADDAVGMEAKSSAWDEFFGHYPVLLKDGVEVGKLNPNDFSKFEDGSSADITSGNAGDVMIAFPRRGVSITTNGNTLTLSMTDDPDNPDFRYYAHERGDTRKEIFYLGAYKGYVNSSKLCSLSGKTPTASQAIGTFRTYAHARGTGYENSGFYQLIFRQVMYVLKYKNLDSQTALGQGYTGGSAAVTTGGTNTSGMDYGATSTTSRVKLFGLEDFWGNIWEWIDGIVTDSTRNILTATDNFNDSGDGYTNRGQGATANIGNYMSKPQGTTETGFLAKEVSGSATTYFCDCANLYASCVARFGGDGSGGSGAGAFRLSVDGAASGSGAGVAARLMYL
jgi:hypothetical protein